MIKAKAEANGRDVYMLALEPENVKRLVEGQPMPINLKEMGGPDVEILIMAGPDYEWLKSQAAGFEAAFDGAKVQERQ